MTLNDRHIKNSSFTPSPAHTALKKVAKVAGLIIATLVGADTLGDIETDNQRCRLDNINPHRGNDNILAINTLKKITTMATMMKSNDSALAVMMQMLQERCIAEPSFAIKMANPSKSVEGAVNYLCSQIQKSGVCMVDDNTVLSLLTHYFDENEIEDCGKVNCNIVVSKPELSEEDKEMLKEQARAEYKEEQLRQIRRENAPKATPKPTATAPKKGAEIDTIPNLFDEL